MKDIEKAKIAKEIRKIRKLLFQKMKEVGFPIKAGQGEIKTKEDVEKVKREVEEILWQQVRRQYTVVKRPEYPSTPSHLNYLIENIVKKASLREAYGRALLELGRRNEDIVVLCASLSGSTKTRLFAKEFPNRFFDLGVAEQDMMGTAAGLAASGKIPFANTWAIFATGRAWEQIRQSIAYAGLNVKIVASHGGITVGDDGGSYQGIEDIALMRVLPNMVVIVPADAIEMRKVIYAIAHYKGPVYVRSSRIDFPVIYNEDCHFQIGKGSILREGEDITIIATGLMVHHALEAAKELAKAGIEAMVINMSTIKPIDKELIIESAKITKIILTAEEHLIVGGLGSAVCQVLAESYPVPVKQIGINDRFGISGKPETLLAYFHLMPKDIAEAAKRIFMEHKPKLVKLKIV